MSWACPVSRRSNINGTNLDDPGVVAILEAARDLGAAVFVHPWEMLGRIDIPDTDFPGWWACPRRPQPPCAR